MDRSEIAVSIFNKYASEYQGKFMDVSLYRDSLDFFCENLPATQPKVLELACGPGNVTRYLLDKRPDLEVIGSDLSENMITLAKRNNPEASFVILDCRAIGGLNKKFDAVMCSFCLPYLDKNEVKKLIADIFKVLNPAGILYISTMEDKYENSGPRRGSQGDEMYMHFYEENFLAAALEKAGFHLLKTDRQLSQTTDGATVTDLVIIAKKR